MGLSSGHFSAGKIHNHHLEVKNSVGHSGLPTRRKNSFIPNLIEIWMFLQISKSKSASMSSCPSLNILGNPLCQTCYFSLEFLPSVPPYLVLVDLGVAGRELDGDAAAVVHDALDELAAGADHGVVDLVRDLDVHGDDVRHLGLDALNLRRMEGETPELRKENY